MADAALKTTLIAAGKVLAAAGQGDFTRGHISVRVPKKPSLFYMKPHSVAVHPSPKLVAAVVGALAWQVSPRFRERVAHTLPAFTGTSAGVDTALTGRLDIWTTSLRLYATHVVNGVGVRGFRVAYPSAASPGDHFLTMEKCGEGEGACHPHQVVLEVATETGTLGLLAWLAALNLAVRTWWRAGPAARARAFPATVALAAILFPLNTHMAFYSAWWGLLAAWLLSVWCAALFADLPDAEAGHGA